MNAEDFRLLYDYNSWANHRTLATCSQLTEVQFTRDMGSSFRSVRDTLVHVMLVEWLCSNVGPAARRIPSPLVRNFQTRNPCAPAGRKLTTT